ncbi:hypothetical protein N657DRAFT_6518 [Parathielavia appendiculata]|uniref:Uncharacterized protein n=1 Tax=Parathielavia appendiculata TaxID=2587402 RepID=A0AAN6Z739_9PEZI|nr:hypothetical protein N657DRAFT_6518 [Parathielavia appendiculata]
MTREHIWNGTQVRRKDRYGIRSPDKNSIRKDARVSRAGAGACSKHWTGCCENRSVLKARRGVSPLLDEMDRRYACAAAGLLMVLAPKALVVVERRAGCHTHVRCGYREVSPRMGESAAPDRFLCSKHPLLPTVPNP